LWGRGEDYTGFCWGNLRERDHLGDPGVVGRVILRWIYRKWNVGVWTGPELSQNADRWWAFLIAVMNLQVQ